MDNYRATTVSATFINFSFRTFFSISPRFLLDTCRQCYWNEPSIERSLLRYSQAWSHCRTYWTSWKLKNSPIWFLNCISFELSVWQCVLSLRLNFEFKLKIKKFQRTNFQFRQDSYIDDSAWPARFDLTHKANHKIKQKPIYFADDRALEKKLLYRRVPTPGELNIEDVKKSKYFFCWRILNVSKSSKFEKSQGL